MDFESRLAQHGFDKVPNIFVVFYYDGDSKVGHGPPSHLVTLRSPFADAAATMISPAPTGIVRIPTLGANSRSAR